MAAMVCPICRERKAEMQGAQSAWCAMDASQGALAHESLASEHRSQDPRDPKDPKTPNPNRNHQTLKTSGEGYIMNNTMLRSA